MIDPLNLQSIAIDIPPTQQEETAPQNGFWNRITTMPTSQKGLLISLGAYSVCTAFVVIAKFFEADPPPNSLMPSSFVDSSVVAKNTQKWGFGLISLTTAAATTLYARYFLERNQQQAENPITPEIASIIEECVEKEMINATPESSGLQEHELT